MTTEEKIKGLEHLLRKCPDVITALEASRLIHVSKNSIHAAINEGKLIAYASTIFAIPAPRCSLHKACQ